MGRVNSFHNISLITSAQTPWYKGYNIEWEHNILCFASRNFFFLRICQMLICPSNRIYNHLTLLDEKVISKKYGERTTWGNYRISFEKILFHIYLDDTFAANYSGAFPKSTAKIKFGGDVFK